MWVEGLGGAVLHRGTLVALHSWGAYWLFMLVTGKWCFVQGKDLGAFSDIGALTMFADYRVPVVLRQMGILRYSSLLAAKASPALGPTSTSLGSCLFWTWAYKYLAKERQD